MNKSEIALCELMLYQAKILILKLKLGALYFIHLFTSALAFILHHADGFSINNRQLLM